MTAPDQDTSAAPAQPSTADQSDLAATCERLQRQLEALISQQDAEAAVESLDAAVASLKQVEHQNVSSVQLVALADLRRATDT
jgi:hypothetical protein